MLFFCLVLALRMFLLRLSHILCKLLIILFYTLYVCTCLWLFLYGCINCLKENEVLLLLSIKGFPLVYFVIVMECTLYCTFHSFREFHILDTRRKPPPVRTSTNPGLRRHRIHIPRHRCNSISTYEFFVMATSSVHEMYNSTVTVPRHFNVSNLFPHYLQ